MTVTDYIDDLDRALRGPARAKRRLLGEATAGIEDAADAYETAGLEPARAADRALADFGTVAQVGAAFQEELDVAAARRTATVHMISAPLLVGVWKTIWHLNPYEPRHVSALVIAIGLALAGAVGVTCVAGAATLLRTGRFDRGGACPDQRLWTLVGTVAAGCAPPTLLAVAPRMFLSPLILLPLAMTAAVITYAAVSARPAFAFGQGRLSAHP